MNVGVQDVYENPEERKRYTRLIAKQGFVKDYPVNLIKKDGTVISTLITSVAIKDRDGNLAGFQGTIRDITDRNQAEEALKVSEEKFRNLYENSP